MILTVVLVAWMTGAAWAAETPATKPVSDQWMPYNAAGQWGFIDRDAKRVDFVLPPAYELAYPFRYGRAAVRKGGDWGFIDEKGAVAIDYQYQEVQGGLFRAGVAVVKKNGLWGAIDAAGKEILPIKYRGVTVDDKAGRILASIPDPANPDGFDGLWGMFDLAGKELAPPQYSYISPWFKDGVTAVVKGGKHGLIGADGKLIAPLQYDQMLYGDIPHYIAVKGDESVKEKVHDLYSASGKLWFTATSSYVGALSENRATFKDANKLTGYLDETGKVVIQPQFVMAGGFSEGLAIVQRKTGGPIEAIDTAGKSVGTAANAFIRLDKFKHGVAWIADRTDKKLYLYDKQMKRVFPQGFYYASDFDANGLSRAQFEAKKNGLINLKGEWVLQPEWSGIELSSIPGQYIVTNGKEKGIVDATGKVLFKPQAVNLDRWDDKFVKVGPAGFLMGPEYFCFWRADGVYFYNQAKPE